MFLDVTLQPRKIEKQQEEIIKPKYNWVYENNINSGKKLIDLDEPQEFKYDKWRTNSSLSNFNDTLNSAQQMNLNAHLSDKLHYHYLFYSVRKYNRYGKKKTDQEKELEAMLKKQEEAITLIQKYYNFSYKKAAEAYKILTTKQLNYIKSVLIKGKD